MLLTNKGYYIPKYLYKRKIELIRQKIIKRKYGYLFYRKTLSEILPSQARQHYIFCLKKKYLKKWILHWYEEVIEWKLILRAEIHYNLSILQCVLRKWKCFHIQHKTTRIKEKIALIHYQTNCIRQQKHFYFYKWKLYMNYKAEQKYKIKFAWNHFKSKYKPIMLLQYYSRWNIYTKASKKNYLRMLNAKRFFERKLIFEMFNKLRIYTNKRNVKSELIKNVTTLYERNLEQKVIKTWFLFTKQKQQKTQNVVLSKTHYFYKLKLNCFSKLLRNKNRKVYIRYNLEVIKNLQCKRQKINCFTKLKKNVQQRVSKRRRTSHATFYFNTKLKKKVLNGWKKYLCYRQEKKLIEQQLLNIITSQLNANKIAHAFKKWRLFLNYKMKQKHKMYIASNFYTKCILKDKFKIWLYFVCYKRAKTLKKTNAVLHYDFYLKRLSFNMWQTSANAEKYFRQKLHEATEHYQSKIINNGLLLILKAGLNKKQENLRISKERVYYQLFLAQKYLGIWKQNTLYKNVGCVNENETKETTLEEDKENMPRVSNFEWYQICFLTPRLPKNYLKDHLENA